MRHLNAGKKLGRNTAHRRALLRNLVTSLVLEERIQTTVPKAKAMRPLAERMVTLGKRGSLHARYLLDAQAVAKLFDSIALRFGDRAGGYTRIVKTGFRHGDNAEMAYIEFLGSEAMQAAKRKQRSERLERKAVAQKKATEELGRKSEEE